MNLKQKISTIQWGNLVKDDYTIDINYNLFKSEIKGLLDKHIPLKQIISKQKKKKTNKTRLTKGLKVVCTNKRLL